MPPLKLKLYRTHWMNRKDLIVSRLLRLRPRRRTSNSSEPTYPDNSHRCKSMYKLWAIASLMALCACSSPRVAVVSPTVCPSPPENLMTPARPLDGLTSFKEWFGTTDRPDKTPSSSTR